MKRSGKIRWPHVALAAGVCAAVMAAVFWANLPSAEKLRHSNPASTALIDARAREAHRKGRPAPEQMSILTEPGDVLRVSRLALCALTLDALTLGLRLLGVPIPERM